MYQIPGPITAPSLSETAGDVTRLIADQRIHGPFGRSWGGSSNGPPGFCIMDLALQTAESGAS